MKQRWGRGEIYMGHLMALKTACAVGTRPARQGRVREVRAQWRNDGSEARRKVVVMIDGRGLTDGSTAWMR